MSSSRQAGKICGFFFFIIVVVALFFFSKMYWNTDDRCHVVLFDMSFCIHFKMKTFVIRALVSP